MFLLLSAPGFAVLSGKAQRWARATSGPQELLIHAAAPLSALAQATERMRRIDVLMSFEADEPEVHARRTAFVQGLPKLGAATFRLTPGGPRMMPIAIADIQRDWLPRRRT